MKLRLQGDSVRVRLSRAEVDSLGSGNSVETSTRLSAGELTVQLAQASGGWDASLSDGTLLIRAPGLGAWAHTDLEGMYGTAGPCSIAIEKDFACLHRDDDGNAGTFPNPMAGVKQ